MARGVANSVDGSDVVAKDHVWILTVHLIRPGQSPGGGIKSNGTGQPARTQHEHLTRVSVEQRAEGLDVPGPYGLQPRASGRRGLALVRPPLWSHITTVGTAAPRPERAPEPSADLGVGATVARRPSRRWGQVT